MGGGGKFRSLSPVFSKLGIHHRISCPHSHAQNGSVERKHRHIVETGLTLLHHASLPIKFWDFAFLTAAYLINRLPSPLLHYKSPFQLLYHRSPTYSTLRTFGCACWPNLRPYTRHKLEPRSHLCVFMGYNTDHQGYLCYSLTTHKIFTNRDVIFDENMFPYASHTFPSPSINPTTKLPIFMSPPADSTSSSPSSHPNHSPTHSTSSHPNHSPTYSTSSLHSLPTPSTHSPFVPSLPSPT